jgi:hypothetical protein
VHRVPVCPDLRGTAVYPDLYGTGYTFQAGFERKFSNIGDGEIPAISNKQLKNAKESLNTPAP